MKLFFRHFRKNPFYGFINLAGLAIGLAVCWFILLFISNELSYDRFLDKADRICQLNLTGNFGGVPFETSNTPPPLAAALEAEFGEIAASTRMFKPGDVVINRPDGPADALSTEAGLRAVDSNFLTVFSFPLLEGSAATCLNDPHSIVLTEEMARKYFGRGPALGEILLLDNQPFKITGILRDLPGTSSLQFDFLTPISAYPVVKRFSWSWVWLQVDTYVLLHERADKGAIGKLEARFPEMVKKHAADAFRQIGQPLDEFLKKGGQWDFSLKPLTKVHLYSAGIGSRLQTLGDIEEVYIFSTVGLFVLLLACVNFMNLSTARSARRMREVGIRKALGSQQSALMRQFLAESMLYSALAAGIALLLVLAALPAVNRLTGEELHLSQLFAGPWGLVALLLPALTGLLGGSYPAFYLSAFKPAHILKGAVLRARPLVAVVRSGLVVFQFTVSIALLVCTYVVAKQLAFARRGDVGLERENVLIINNVQRLGSGQESFRQRLLQEPEVLRAGLSTDLPARKSFGDLYVPEPGASGQSVAKDVPLESFMVDYDFVPALSIRIKAGRNFSPDFPSDSSGVILNETAVRFIGWKDPIGQYMTYPGNGNQRFQVIGVMQDFATQSVRTAIQPFALFHQSSHTYELPQSFLVVRLRPGEEKKAVAAAENIWKAAAPGAPFDYGFMDADFEALYRSEQKVGDVLSVLAALSVFIACLGLFGLITFAVEQRKREIGIRKVLGASVTSIAGLLSRDFLKLVVLAILLAAPIAWYCMNNWLADFAYRIDLQWWWFLGAGAVAVVIAFLTVSGQSVKAAMTNPVEVLRRD